MPRTLVLYHANCADGFCAAWVARKHLGDSAEYVPVQHGQPPPDVSEREVYIVDFSYDAKTLEQLTSAAERIVLLDHHVSAQKELYAFVRTNVHVYFDMERSGGRLAWDYFFPETPAPWLVDYTEDRDLWRWKLPWSKEISAFLASYEHNFAQWDFWEQFGPNHGAFAAYVDAGAAILRYQARTVDYLCSLAYNASVAGYVVPCVNTAILVSEVAGRLAENKPFAACWFASGGKRVWSLRSSASGVDVSEVAKRLGGGGHRSAAGFQESA